MAKAQLPDPLARRHLLEGSLDADKARAVGELYLAAGREVEAIDFLARGEAMEALGALRDTAISRGDVFLMRGVASALGEEPDAATWTQLAESAERSGRLRDAETARRLATVDG